MAAGLAARIKDIFGVTPRLVEGHDGIYEIMIDGQTAVTNKSKCSGIPSEDEILQEICKIHRQIFRIGHLIFFSVLKLLHLLLGEISTRIPGCFFLKK